MTTLATITIAQALSNTQDPSLYVLNRTQPESIVMFSVGSRDNPEGYMVQVPVTWVPVDLSSQCPREELLRSPQFRRLVESEMVSILKTDECERFFQQDSMAATERRRLLMGQKEMEKAQASNNQVKISAPSAKGTEKAPEKATEATVAPRLRTLIMSVNEGETSVEQAVAAIGQMSLNAAEKQFILSNCQKSEVRVAATK